MFRDDSEGLWGGASFSDLMEKMRYRQTMRSRSREPSICSNLSESQLNSPSSFRKFPFKRDDSVCSNLSDLAMSECSELSMDISVKEEVNNTFRCLEEIEHNLDELKSSVLQMDEEVHSFVAKPDPYSLKMTFSDYSLSSKDDPDSLSVISESRESGRRRRPSGSSVRRAESRRRLDTISTSGEEESAEALREGDKRVIRASDTEGLRASDTEADVSLEWDSPRHGWASAQGKGFSSPAIGTVSHRQQNLKNFHHYYPFFYFLVSFIHIIKYWEHASIVSFAFMSLYSYIGIYFLFFLFFVIIFFFVYSL